MNTIRVFTSIAHTYQYQTWSYWRIRIYKIYILIEKSGNDVEKKILTNLIRNVHNQIKTLRNRLQIYATSTYNNRIKNL